MDLEKGTSLNIEAGSYKILITRQPDSVIRGFKDKQKENNIIDACDAIMLYNKFAK